MRTAREFGISPVLDQTTRADRRRLVTDAELDGVWSTVYEKRSRYTFDAIAYHNEVWTVWDGDELPSFQTENGWAFDIFPHERFASRYGVQHPRIATPEAVPIPIDDFIDEVLSIERNDQEVRIFPKGPGEVVEVMSGDDFIRHIRDMWTDLRLVPGL